MSSSVSESLSSSFFTDRQQRIELLRRVGGAFNDKLNRGHGRERGWSMQQRGANARLVLDKADETIFNAMRQIVLRERQACAQLAGSRCPEAAAEILSRPLPPEWQGETLAESVKRMVAGVEALMAARKAVQP